MVTLSILDQVPAFNGKTSEQTIQECIALAQHAEQLGYKRFWVAEHHGGSLMCASPEILTAAIATQTSSIRVGTGGIMLPHYSPLKIAETFRLLHALSPNRVDLGIGRGPGSSPLIDKALYSSARTNSAEEYTQQVQELLHFLDDTFPENHIYKPIRVMPDSSQGKPEVWILSSSRQGSSIASSLGLPYSFAQFSHNRTYSHIVNTYRRSFCPSSSLTKPYISLAVRTICAETEEEAQYLASSFWLVQIRALTNKDIGISNNPPRIPTAEEAIKFCYSKEHLAYIQDNSLLMITGTPSQVKRQILDLMEIYEADELIVTTICSDFTARLHSYELLQSALQE